MATSIREFVTINRGTGDGGGVTRIGDDNWMHGLHAYRPRLPGRQPHASSPTTPRWPATSRSATTSILSGFAGVHQFCRIGAHAFIGMGAFVNGDVPPFVMVAQEGYGRPRGINSEGLKRRGFDADRIAAIKRAYRALVHVRAPSWTKPRANWPSIAAEAPTCAPCWTSSNAASGRCCGEGRHSGTGIGNVIRKRRDRASKPDPQAELRRSAVALWRLPASHELAMTIPNPDAHSRCLSCRRRKPPATSSVRG